ncbi:hypothetical protein [Actinoplanes sp. NPDC049316]|uniref:hypothetical protein n=1 Tax=Actinoplanes sp. NPDC049316 TaxID=3154727 RepID=UPI0034412D83
MRHLRSILYALVLGPAAWILCGAGFDEDLTGRARDNGGPESVGGLLLLLLAGAAYAILLFAPISPAGPLTAGAAFLGVGAWARIAPDAYAGIWPAEIAKGGFNLSTPGYGLALLLAVPLLCTALSARRWAGYEPPQVVFIGTLGRARGAAAVPGTPMASERTTVFAVDDEDEKTTLLSGLFPAQEQEAHSGVHSEVHSGAHSEAPTQDVAKSEEVTTVLSPAPPTTDGEKTQVLGPAEVPGDRTQVLAPVDVAGDRTQVLAPVDAAPELDPEAGEATTKAMSVVGEERPDPAQDPTTRLTPVPAAPAPSPVREKTTVANLERPADEAADDTRPITLPAPRRPDEDETTRRL